MSNPSHRRRAAVLAVAAGTVLVSAVAVSGPAHAATTYYRAVASCAAPAPGHAGCFALKRVRVANASVPGARAAAARKPGVAAGPAGGYTPGDLAKAYGVQASTATTQTVAIIDAFNDPNARADLSVFDAQYGLPAETTTSLRIVSQRGNTTDLPANDTTGWSTEESLDLDAVRGLCNKCKIILVETDSDSFADLAAGTNRAVSLGANEVSNSYGGVSDATDPTTPADLAAYNHKGVVITASTGDDGFYDWDYSNYTSPYAAAPPAGTQTASSNDSETPAAFSSVVAVGGTTLQLNDDGTRSGESVWNENGTLDNSGFFLGSPLGATGGGCSVEYTAAKWQSTTANYAKTGCGTRRASADVSALADPATGYDIYDSFQVAQQNTCTPPHCWSTYGGTSLSSPLVSAMWGLAGGSGGVPYPALTLYGHLKSADHSLYDVTIGGNGSCGGGPAAECGAAYGNDTPNTVGLGILDCAWDATGNPQANTRVCNAAPGYDGPSGVGTPNGLTLFRPLSPTARITVPASVTHGHAVRLSGAASTDPFPGGTVKSYSWDFGDHTASASASPSHTFARRATYTIRLVVTDSYGRTASVSKKVAVK